MEPPDVFTMCCRTLKDVRITENIAGTARETCRLCGDTLLVTPEGQAMAMGRHPIYLCSACAVVIMEVGKAIGEPLEQVHIGDAAKAQLERSPNARKTFETMKAAMRKEDE